MGGLSISASGIIAASQRNDVTANNVANLRTPGFQSQRAELSETQGGGVRVSATSRNTQQGPLQATGRPLDVAADDDTYFQVQRPDGSTAYTRSGSFSVNGDGQLTTADGSTVEPPVNVPTNATSVTVGEDGTVFATVPGDLEPRVVGQIETYRFSNPGGLSALGNNQFAPTAASGEAQQARASVTPGFLEQSNVDLVEQTVNQISDANLLRANANAFRAQADLTQEVLRILD